MNEPLLLVRRASEADLDAVADVWHQSALAMDGVADVPPLAALRARIDVELQSGWDLYVALRGRDLVGMLALKPDAACLDQIFVLPGAQGQGVGRALLNVAKQLIAEGFSLRMATTNAKARLFYEREGLVKTGDGIHPSTGVPGQFYSWNVR